MRAMPAHPLARKTLFCAACIFSGWLSAFSMPPASYWPLIFIGMSGLYWLFARTQTAGQAFSAGFFFGIGYFTTGLWWIGNALLVEGSEFVWVWPLSVIGLPTLLSLFTGLYVSIARIAFNPKTVPGFLSFCLLLSFSEWARGHAFTGFPWNLYGYIWADHLPMAQGFYVFGAFGMTLITIVWAALAGFAVQSPYTQVQKSVLLLFPVMTMTLLFAYGKNRLDTNPTAYDLETGVVVVQPNIPQTMKWDPDQIQDNFAKTLSLSKAGYFGEKTPKSILVVWPETALSPSIYSYSENMDAIRDMLETYEADAYLLTGILQRYQSGENISYTNSVALIDKQINTLDIYNKTHLVPFGEFIPFQRWIPIAPVAAYKGFEKGTGATTIQRNDIPAFSPLVCYEIIFPGSVVSAKDHKRPRWIVNVTNDGWYGRSAGPYQHYAQTRLRAIEEGLPVIRSANTGISGIIDAYGRTLQSADIYKEAVIVSSLPIAAAPSKTGGLAIYLIISLSFCLILYSFREKRA
jgi:apolipoprotein N-acyltransferase